MIAQEIYLDLRAESPIPNELKNTLNLPKKVNPKKIKNVLDSISEKLQLLGYIENFPKDFEKENDTLYISTFFLGKKYNHLTIYFDPEEFNYIDLRKVVSTIKDSAFTVPLADTGKILNSLSVQISRKGHAFAKVKLSEITVSEDSEISARLELNPGKFRRIDSVVIKGYEKFPKGFLKHYAGIKKGIHFDHESLLSKNKRLDHLPFASSNRPPEILFRKNTTIAYLYLQKESNNNFDGVLGFATDEETQKLIFNGYLNLELNNNFNYGEEFSLNYRADGKEQLEFHAKLKLHFLFQTRFGIGGALRIFKRDSSFVTTEQQIQLSYRLTPDSQIFTGYKGVNSANLLSQHQAGAPIENFKSNYWIIGQSTAVLQDNSIFPLQTEILSEINIGSRKRDGTNDRQFRIENTVRHIFNLSPLSSVFLQSKSAYLHSDDYLTNELYRFGGINSLRGFDENSIDASFYTTIAIEYRYVLNPNLFVHTLTDGGYFENPIHHRKHKLYSFGIGIGMSTKSGLFRLLVANGTIQGNQPVFANSKVHLSMTSRF